MFFSRCPDRQTRREGLRRVPLVPNRAFDWAFCKTTQRKRQSHLMCQTSTLATSKTTNNCETTLSTIFCTSLSFSRCTFSHGLHARHVAAAALTDSSTSASCGPSTEPSSLAYSHVPLSQPPYPAGIPAVAPAIAGPCAVMRGSCPACLDPRLSGPFAMPVRI